MIRLYLKEIFNEAIIVSEMLMSTLEKRMSEEAIPMPGYTHYQKAMPTNTRTWLGSFHDAL
jgi:argininosuccinate lyase